MSAQFVAQFIQFAFWRGATLRRPVPSQCDRLPQRDRANPPRHTVMPPGSGLTSHKANDAAQKSLSQWVFDVIFLR
jgi:hypothetical protein